MRAHTKAIVLMIGVALLAFVGMSSIVFAPPPGPPPPSCEVTLVSIQGPSEVTAGNKVTLRGKAELGQFCSIPTFRWQLLSAPTEANPWRATGEQVSYTPEVSGEYRFLLTVTADSTEGGASGNNSALHTLKVKEAGSQPSEIQEFALILGPGSELQTFPAMLRVSAGSLRLFLTSLDQAVTAVIRREGAQAGVSTALVEPGKLTTLEVKLAPGVYELIVQGTDAILGRIEAR